MWKTYSRNKNAPRRNHVLYVRRQIRLVNQWRRGRKGLWDRYEPFFLNSFSGLAVSWLDPFNVFVVFVRTNDFSRMRFKVRTTTNRFAYDIETDIDLGLHGFLKVGVFFLVRDNLDCGHRWR
jgi:hypothetical protein